MMKQLCISLMFCLFVGCSCSTIISPPELPEFEAPESCDTTYNAVFHLNEDSLYYYSKPYIDSIKDEIICLTLLTIGEAKKREDISLTPTWYGVSFYNDTDRIVYRFVFYPSINMASQEAIVPIIVEEDTMFKVKVYRYYIDPYTFGAILATNGKISIEPTTVGRGRMTQGQFERVLSSYLHTLGQEIGDEPTTQ